MNKFCLILILFLGFFLLPAKTYACGSDSGKHSCKMEMSSKTKMKTCCCKNSKSKETKGHKGCSGKCGQAMCGVSSVNIGNTTSTVYEMIQTHFGFSSKKQNFSSLISVPSDGYTSLWLIPKIG